MKFEHKLIRGRLIKRYKRFLADVRLDDGELVTAHCANSGSMMGLKDESNIVWLLPQTNPKAKLPYKWELVEVEGVLVGINTMRPNGLVEDAIKDGTISELQGYKELRREVKYGENSRIDILLSGPDAGPDCEVSDCYVEVKSVTLSREPGLAEFPDSVTARGTKHLQELSNMVAAGHRAVMVYLIQRADCREFTIAADIDPTYAAALRAAVCAGVEVICYGCVLSLKEIRVEGSYPLRF